MGVRAKEGKTNYVVQEHDGGHLVLGQQVDDGGSCELPGAEW